MKVGDLIKMVTSYRDDLNRLGLVVSVDPLDYHNRVVTVMINQDELVTWPVDSHYQIEVVSESR